MFSYKSNKKVTPLEQVEEWLKKPDTRTTEGNSDSYWKKYISGDSPYRQNDRRVHAQYLAPQPNIKYNDKIKIRPVSSDEYRRLKIKTHVPQKSEIPVYADVPRWPEEIQQKQLSGKLAVHRYEEELASSPLRGAGRTGSRPTSPEHNHSNTNVNVPDIDNTHNTQQSLGPHGSFHLLENEEAAIRAIQVALFRATAVYLSKDEKDELYNTLQVSTPMAENRVKVSLNTVKENKKNRQPVVSLKTVQLPPSKKPVSHAEKYVKPQNRPLSPPKHKQFVSRLPPPDMSDIGATSTVSAVVDEATGDIVHHIVASSGGKKRQSVFSSVWNPNTVNQAWLVANDPVHAVQQQQRINAAHNRRGSAAAVSSGGSSPAPVHLVTPGYPLVGEVGHNSDNSLVRGDSLVSLGSGTSKDTLRRRRSITLIAIRGSNSASIERTVGAAEGTNMDAHGGPTGGTTAGVSLGTDGCEEAQMVESPAKVAMTALMGSNITTSARMMPPSELPRGGDDVEAGNGVSTSSVAAPIVAESDISYTNDADFVIDEDDENEEDYGADDDFLEAVNAAKVLEKPSSLPEAELLRDAVVTAGANDNSSINNIQCVSSSNVEQHDDVDLMMPTVGVSLLVNNSPRQAARPQSASASRPISARPQSASGGGRAPQAAAAAAHIRGVGRQGSAGTGMLLIGTLAEMDIITANDNIISDDVPLNDQINVANNTRRTNNNSISNMDVNNDHSKVVNSISGAPLVRQTSQPLKVVQETVNDYNNDVFSATVTPAEALHCIISATDPKEINDVNNQTLAVLSHDDTAAASAVATAVSVVATSTEPLQSLQTDLNNSSNALTAVASSSKPATVSSKTKLVPPVPVSNKKNNNANSSKNISPRGTSSTSSTPRSRLTSPRVNNIVSDSNTQQPAGQPHQQQKHQQLTSKTIHHSSATPPFPSPRSSGGGSSSNSSSSRANAKAVKDNNETSTSASATEFAVGETVKIKMAVATGVSVGPPVVLYADAVIERTQSGSGGHAVAANVTYDVKYVKDGRTEAKVLASRLLKAPLIPSSTTTTTAVVAAAVAVDTSCNITSDSPRKEIVVPARGDVVPSASSADVCDTFSKKEGEDLTVNLAAFSAAAAAVAPVVMVLAGATPVSNVADEQEQQRPSPVVVVAVVAEATPKRHPAPAFLAELAATKKKKPSVAAAGTGTGDNKDEPITLAASIQISASQTVQKVISSGLDIATKVATNIAIENAQRKAAWELFVELSNNELNMELSDFVPQCSMQKLLGRGKFAAVYSALWTTKSRDSGLSVVQPVAVKIAQFLGCESNLSFQPCSPSSGDFDGDDDDDVIPTGFYEGEGGLDATFQSQQTENGITSHHHHNNSSSNNRNSSKQQQLIMKVSQPLPGHIEGTKHAPWKRPPLTCISEFTREIQCLKQLGTHAKLVELRGYVLRPFCLVLSLCSLGSLHSNLHDVTFQQALSVEDRLLLMQDISEGMAYVHKRGFLHRDIKAHNILIDTYIDPSCDNNSASGSCSSCIPVVDVYQYYVGANEDSDDEKEQAAIGIGGSEADPQKTDSIVKPTRPRRRFVAKIADFGSAVPLLMPGSTEAAADKNDVDNVGCYCMEPAGTSGYTAPEMYGGRYSFPSDVFSFAIVCWELLPHFQSTSIVPSTGGGGGGAGSAVAAGLRPLLQLRVPDHNPWTGHDPDDIVHQIQDGVRPPVSCLTEHGAAISVSFPFPSSCTKDATGTAGAPGSGDNAALVQSVHLIKQCWATLPAGRPSMESTYLQLTDIITRAAWTTD